MSKSDLILVTHEPAIVRAVAQAVERSSEKLKWETCDSLDDLQLRLDHDVVPAVVVDLNAQPEWVIHELDPIISRHSGSRFVLLADKADSDLMMRAMQAGARHVISKREVAAELMQVLRRFSTPVASPNGSVGAIACVLSAGGGCGATTFAISLAHELALSANGGPRHRSLLIDLDCVFGSAAYYLGKDSRFGVADVLADAERLDAELIKSTAVAATENLDVLVSPATTDFLAPPAPRFEHLSRLLHQSRQIYGHIVIDAPRLPIDISLVLVRSSVITFIVLEANVEDIRIARELYAGLTQRGARNQFVVPIVNRHRGRKDPISLEDAKRAIGCQRIAALSNDFKNIVDCVNYGRPIGEQAPRSSYRKDVQTCVDDVRAAIAARRQSSVDVS